MTIIKALCELCKVSKKYGIYLGFEEEPFAPEEVKKACPFLNFDYDDIPSSLVNTDDYLDYQAYSDGHMFILCNSEEECYSLYDQVVGDDGPTKSNKYDGPCRVYCLTINSNGEMENENT
jgi:hypothetical protein